MSDSVILMALDLDNLIQILIVFMFFVLPVIGQIFKAARKGDGQAKPRLERRPQRPEERPQQPQVAQAPVAEDPLKNEIDAFLREAARNREGLAKNEIEVLQPDMAPQPTVHVELVKPQPKVAESVAEHVEHHIETEKFERRSARLGANVGQADEKLEGRLHDVFDHKLGRLPHEEEASPIASAAEGTDASVWESTGDKRQQRNEAAAKSAAEIADMLRHPVELRKAVILSEILRRPVD